jgi:NAD+ synthase
MSMLYYHAELRNYAVIGTANKNEHGLGFFVKHGDGGVDIAPILHLFKTQVYQLAKTLNVPVEIRERIPTSDTYSAGSTQEEFFFRIPFDVLDIVWAAWEADYSPEQIGAQIDLPTDQVQRVIDDIIRKQRTTAYLREPVVEY